MRPKIVIIGDIATGKTSILRRFQNNEFIERYVHTESMHGGCSFIDNVQINLIEIANYTRFFNILNSFAHEIVGAFVIIDSIDDYSKDGAQGWRSDLNSICANIPIILLVNKCDIIESSPEMVYEGYDAWLQVSAKTGEGITDAWNMMSILMKEWNLK